MLFEKNAMIIGKRAFEFIAEAIIDNEVREVNSLDFYGTYVLYFFYSNDFSFVCPTEMHALQDKLDEFKKRGVEVVGISTDSIQAHIAWLKVPRDKDGIQGVTFPLISDVNKKLSRAYCILDEKKGTCLRGAFIANKDGLIQYGAVNNADVGRNINELIRVVDAIQMIERYGKLCPVNWHVGEKTISLNEK